MIKVIIADMVLAMTIATVFVLGSPMQISGRKWGQVSEGFQMSAAVVKEVVVSGEPVLLELTIKNISKQVLTLKETTPWRDYDLSVKMGKVMMCR